MEKDPISKSAPRGTKLEDSVRLGSDHLFSRVPYFYNGRQPLSRKSKALLSLLQKHLPVDIHEHLKAELAVEARRDQNMLVELIFAELIDSFEFCNTPKDNRLRVKLNELADLVFDHLD